MTPQEIAEALSALVQLDVDAVVAHDRGIAAVGDGPIATRLAHFKLDHQRHVVELSRALLDLSVRPPHAQPDMKGTLLGGVTALRARLGVEQALLAMRTNERMTAGTYARALAKPLPGPLLELVRRADADEQRHLAWIERAIDGRSWEEQAGAGVQE
jgi:hypothetical protein